MKILYGKYESSQVSVTCHAHVDADHIYSYEIMMFEKSSNCYSMMNLKRFEYGSFELLVELVKRNKPVKLVKRLFGYMQERNLVKGLGTKVILKNKAEAREQVVAYLSRKSMLTGQERLSDFYSEEFINDVLDVISGSSIK